MDDEAADMGEAAGTPVTLVQAWPGSATELSEVDDLTNTKTLWNSNPVLFCRGSFQEFSPGRSETLASLMLAEPTPSAMPVLLGSRTTFKARLVSSRQKGGD